MKYDNQINNANSYYTAMYDYCLDLIERIIFEKNWVYDEYSKTFMANITEYKCKEERKYKVLNSDGFEKLPVNELNDYFELQNFEYVFDKVLRDLKIKKINNKAGNFDLIIKEKRLEELKKLFSGIHQLSNQNEKDYEVEDYVHITLDLILNSTWKKEGTVSSLAYNIYYDDELDKAVVKIVENDHGVNRILSYKNLYMSKDAFAFFNNELSERFEMLGIEKYNYCDGKLYAKDLNKSRCDFLEYYDEGIKLKKTK